MTCKDKVQLFTIKSYVFCLDIYHIGDDVLWGALKYSIGLFRSSQDQGALKDAQEVGRKAFKEIMRRKDLSQKEQEFSNK